MQFQLVLLAAGRGERFGGPKQFEPVGPQDEVLPHYAWNHAKSAGCEALVLVSHSDLVPLAEERFLNSISDRDKVQLVYQNHAAPQPDPATAWNAPPHGTGTALICALNASEGPWIVANADDYYGAQGFFEAGALLEKLSDESPFGAVLYELDRVVPQEGTVSRGLANIDPDGVLISITETHGIHREGKTIVDRDGAILSPNIPTSMNLWVLSKSGGKSFQSGLRRFLQTNKPPTEFGIPQTIADCMAVERTNAIAVVTSSDWIGLTRREDLPEVRARLL